MKTVDQVNKDIKHNNLQFHLYKDDPLFDGFEITVHEKSDLTDEGKLFYSKLETGKFPHDDKDEMAKLVKAIVEVTD